MPLYRFEKFSKKLRNFKEVALKNLKFLKISEAITNPNIETSATLSTLIQNRRKRVFMKSDKQESTFKLKKIFYRAIRWQQQHKKSGDCTEYTTQNNPHRSLEQLMC